MYNIYIANVHQGIHMCKYIHYYLLKIHYYGKTSTNQG